MDGADAGFPDLADLKTGSSIAWSIAFSYLWPVALRAARGPAEQLTSQEVEEAANDGIRCAMEQIERVENKEELRALVAVIARRRAITMLREKFAAKRAPGGSLVESYESRADEAILAMDDRSDPSRDLMAAETLALMHGALAGLDAESRRLLREKYFEGYSYEELSQRHKQPVGTLCPKVMRALRKVRSALQKSPSLVKELKDFLR